MNAKRIATILLFAGLAACITLLAGWVACTYTTDVPLPGLPVTQAPGSLQKAECIGRYGALPIQALIWWTGMSDDVPVHSGVKLYRLQYWTTDPHGTAVTASGLLAIPRTADVRGVVSFQHATRTQRKMSPSKPTLYEGVLIAAVFAGGGYLLAAPDYLGLGNSQGLHPYVHAATESSTTVDLLKAAETFTKHIGAKWSPSVCLVGFSQGGHATMAAQRALEALNDPRFQVVASAPISGVYDLANITFPETLKGKVPGGSAYLAYIFNAYSGIYGKPLGDIVTAPYDTLIPALFDGNHGEDEIMDALPSEPRAMLSKEFSDAYDSGRPTWLLTALQQNEVFNWKPNAPVRAYFGELDPVVSPREAHTLANTCTKLGADVRAVSMGQTNHIGTLKKSMPLVRVWFDQVSVSSGKPSP